MRLKSAQTAPFEKLRREEEEEVDEKSQEEREFENLVQEDKDYYADPSSLGETLSLSYSSIESICIHLSPNVLYL